VGNDGETLVADSSTSTGLRYQATQAAGKNAVINGAMEVWQRGTSFTATGYTADRWYVTTPGSNTWSRSTDAPSGFNYSMNWISAGSFPGLFNYVELPVTGAKGNFVGTWTYSFYAKASTATTLSLGFQWMDGSSRANNVAITTSSTSFSLTTSWQRFTTTVDFNSSSPVGTNRAIEIGYFLATGGATFNITGCQLEVGSVATSFTRAGGTIQGELAACQRYYQRITSEQAYGSFGSGHLKSATTAEIIIPLKTTLRTTVASASISGNFAVSAGALFLGTSTLAGGSANTSFGNLQLTVSGGTTGYGAVLVANNTTTAFVEFSAEL
jgi:hypothetical protein